MGQLQISAVDSTAVFFRKKKGGRVQMPRGRQARSARAPSVDARPGALRQRVHGLRQTGRKREAITSRVGPIGTSTWPIGRPPPSRARARRSMTASWARPRRPWRGRPAAHCRFGRSTPHKSAPEGVREQWAAGRGAGAARRAANASILPWRRLGRVVLLRWAGLRRHFLATVPKPALCM